MRFVLVYTVYLLFDKGEGIQNGIWKCCKLSHHGNKLHFRIDSNRKQLF